MTDFPFKFGKLPAKPLPPEAKKFALSNFFAKVDWPTVPVKFGKHLLVRDWGMLGNDNVGDCVFAGAAHEHMHATRVGDAFDAEFTTENVLSDYSALTGYDPRDPDSDQGSDMHMAAEYRRTVGIVDANGVRHRIKAHLSLKPSNIPQLAMASYIFEGMVGLGVMWPKSASQQFEDHVPFSVVPRDGGIEGGHYMNVIGRNSMGLFVLVTYGRLQAATPKWIQKYADEAKVYLSDETLINGTTPHGFDLTKLRAFLQHL